MATVNRTFEGMIKQLDNRFGGEICRVKGVNLTYRQNGLGDFIPICSIHQRDLILDESILKSVNSNYNELCGKIYDILNSRSSDLSPLDTLARKVIEVAKGTQYGYTCPDCIQVNQSLSDIRRLTDEKQEVLENEARAVNKAGSVWSTLSAVAQYMRGAASLTLFRSRR
jgi:hypothetical protein